MPFFDQFRLLVYPLFPLEKYFLFLISTQCLPFSPLFYFFVLWAPQAGRGGPAGSFCPLWPPLFTDPYGCKIIGRLSLSELNSFPPQLLASIPVFRFFLVFFFYFFSKVVAWTPERPRNGFFFRLGLFRSASAVFFTGAFRPRFNAFFCDPFRSLFLFEKSIFFGDPFFVLMSYVLPTALYSKFAPVNSLVLFLVVPPPPLFNSLFFFLHSPPGSFGQHWRDFRQYYFPFCWSSYYIGDPPSPPPQAVSSFERLALRFFPYGPFCFGFILFLFSLFPLLTILFSCLFFWPLVR